MAESTALKIDSRISRAFENANGWKLEDSLLVMSNVGSISHGTQIPSDDPHNIDDVDVMAIAIPPLAVDLGLHPFDHWVWPRSDSELQKNAAGELDVTVYSVRKFAGLLIKGNPNVLGLLYLEPLESSPLWKNWIQGREIFLSKHSYEAFSGYAYSQLIRLGHPNSRGYMGRERKALFEKYGFDPKNSAHLIRLLRMGIELLREGELHVDRTNIDAEELKEIKTGKWSLGKIQRTAEAGFKEMEALVETTKLPDEPNHLAIRDLVIDTTLRSWAVAVFSPDLHPYG